MVSKVPIKRFSAAIGIFIIAPIPPVLRVESQALANHPVGTLCSWILFRRCSHTKNSVTNISTGPIHNHLISVSFKKYRILILLKLHVLETILSTQTFINKSNRIRFIILFFINNLRIFLIYHHTCNNLATTIFSDLQFIFTFRIFECPEESSTINSSLSFIVIYRWLYK